MASLTAQLFDSVRRRRVDRIYTPWDFTLAARRQLPRLVFDYIDGGAGCESTVRENLRAIDAVRLMPSTPVDVSFCDTSVSLFGERLALPVIIGPTGFASTSWPRGEIAFARAAARNCTRYVMPSGASVSPEDVAAAGQGTAWFQLYPPPNRETAREWLTRIRDCGFSTLEVTVDVAVGGRRSASAGCAERVVTPFRWTPSKVIDCATRLGWAMKMLYHGQPEPHLQMEVDRAAAKSTQGSAFRGYRFTRALDWDLLKFLRDTWPGKLLVKGLVDPRQAKPALDAGYDSIVISNHGGRQLDGSVSTMEVLSEFRAAVGGSMTLLIDGRLPIGRGCREGDRDGRFCGSDRPPVGIRVGDGRGCRGRSRAQAPQSGDRECHGVVRDRESR